MPTSTAPSATNPPTTVCGAPLTSPTPKARTRAKVRSNALMRALLVRVKPAALSAVRGAPSVVGSRDSRRPTPPWGGFVGVEASSALPDTALSASRPCPWAEARVQRPVAVAQVRDHHDESECGLATPRGACAARRRPRPGPHETTSRTVADELPVPCLSPGRATSLASEYPNSPAPPFFMSRAGHIRRRSEEP